ncbi:beige protein [Ceratobasidium sp. AG-Ba]|nr:beige protein [Ceratobasidium sp. AG-Ba]
MLDEAPNDHHQLAWRCVEKSADHLMGTPRFAGKMVFAPVIKIGKDGVRRFDNVWTGDAWNIRQRALPPGTTRGSIIVMSDATLLTGFSGDVSAHGVYMSLANIDKSVRNEISQGAWVLIGIIPKSNWDKTLAAKPGMTLKQRAAVIAMLNRRLFHKCMEVLSPDLLHGLHKFFFDHIHGWNVNAVGAEEYDTRLKSQPETPDHRAIGQVEVAVVAGAPSKSDGGLSRELLKANAAIMDCILIAQQPMQTETTLKTLRQRYSTWHAHKDVWIKNGSKKGKKGKVNNSWIIPKAHIIGHVPDHIKAKGTMDNFNTETMEHLHKPILKESYQASNRREYVIQMVRRLNRLEIMRGYKEFLTWLVAERAREQGITAGSGGQMTGNVEVGDESDDDDSDYNEDDTDHDSDDGRLEKSMKTMMGLRLRTRREREREKERERERERANARRTKSMEPAISLTSIGQPGKKGGSRLTVALVGHEDVELVFHKAAGPPLPELQEPPDDHDHEMSDATYGYHMNANIPSDGAYHQGLYEIGARTILEEHAYQFNNVTERPTFPDTRTALCRVAKVPAVRSIVIDDVSARLGFPKLLQHMQAHPYFANLPRNIFPETQLNVWKLLYLTVPASQFYPKPRKYRVFSHSGLEENTIKRWDAIFYIPTRNQGWRDVELEHLHSYSVGCVALLFGLKPTPEIPNPRLMCYVQRFGNILPKPGFSSLHSIKKAKDRYSPKFEVIAASQVARPCSLAPRIEGPATQGIDGTQSLDYYEHFYINKYRVPEEFFFLQFSRPTPSPLA